MTQKFYKGKEIIYRVAAVPELNTATSWRINKVELGGGSYQYFNLRKIDDSHFGLTCNNNADTSITIHIYIDIVDEHQNIDETRLIYFYWYGKYVQPDKVISTYDKANLLSVAVLRNYATYNITDSMTSSNVGSVFGGINIDPEKDTPISGLRLSQFDDYDDEYNLGTKQNDGKFVQNPNFPDFSTYQSVINDNGEFKITVDSKINNNYIYDTWFNNVDSQTSLLVPPMIPNPSQAYYNYPIIGSNVQMPYLMGLKVEVAPNVFLYCNQYNETSDNQCLSWTTIDKTDRNIYKDVEFRDENDNLIPNTDTIGVMLKTKNFILKSTRNIRKVRIWTNNPDIGYGGSPCSILDADKGTIQVTNKMATYTGSDTSSFPQNQYLYIWEGNSKHIKFSLSNGYLINNSALTPIVGELRTTIHSYTQDNQTTPTQYGAVKFNPKVYLCDNNGDPTSNYYDGTLHSCAWDYIDYTTGNYTPSQVVYDMNQMDATTITLIQVETD